LADVVLVVVSGWVPDGLEAASSKETSTDLQGFPCLTPPISAKAEPRPLANLADARGGSIQVQGKEPITSADLRKAAQLHRGWAKACRLRAFIASRE
jgi:hypothetical protein